MDFVGLLQSMQMEVLFSQAKLWLGALAEDFM
jgi:hypothetical protein